MIAIAIPIRAMEETVATLASGGEVITSAEWKCELRQAMSFAFSPINLVNSSTPYIYAMSPSIQQRISLLLDWCCSRIGSSLAVECLRHAVACGDTVAYYCDATGIPCCFSGVVPKQARVQICFCYARSDGIVQRTQYYVMSQECSVLVKCFYLLGHMMRYTVEHVKRLIATCNDWIDSIVTMRFCEGYRYRFNMCMLVLYQFITSPPCSIRRRRDVVAHAGRGKKRKSDSDHGVRTDRTNTAVG